MRIAVTFFDGPNPHEQVYEGKDGARLLALIDADDYIRHGGWCLIDDGNAARMVTRPIFGKESK